MNRPYLKYVADYQKSAQVFAKNAMLYHLTVMNNSGSAFWAQVWDVSAVGNIGSQATVPDFEINVPSNNVAAFPFHRDGWAFSNGIFVRAVTATQGSSLIAANNAKFSAQYDGPWPLS